MPTAAPDRPLLHFPGPSARRARPAAVRARGGVPAFFNRLAVLAEIAPDSPVSLLVITLPSAIGEDSETLAEAMVRAYVRATDLVARLEPGRIAVVLQGTDATRAARISCRLQVQFSRAAIPGCATAVIGVASGIGRHGRTLLQAASSSLPDCG